MYLYNYLRGLFLGDTWSVLDLLIPFKVTIRHFLSFFHSLFLSMIMAGFTGSICTLSVNFRTLELFASTDWEGQGIAINRHSVSVENISECIYFFHESQQIHCNSLDCKLQCWTRLWHCRIIWMQRNPNGLLHQTWRPCLLILKRKRSLCIHEWLRFSNAIFFIFENIGI